MASDRSYDYDSQLNRLGTDWKTGSGAPEYRSYLKGPDGTVEGLEGQNGVVAANETYKYDPYGADLTDNTSAPGTTPGPPLAAATSLDQAAQDNPFRFRGFYYDAGIKSYDMQAREYQPLVGRFTTPDRLESAGADYALQADPLTQDRYAFADGNPVNNIEWDGHEPPGSFTQGCDPSYGRHCGGRRGASRRRAIRSVTPLYRQGIAGAQLSSAFHAVASAARGIAGASSFVNLAQFSVQSITRAFPSINTATSGLSRFLFTPCTSNCDPIGNFLSSLPQRLVELRLRADLGSGLSLSNTLDQLSLLPLPETVAARLGGIAIKVGEKFGPRAAEFAGRLFGGNGASGAGDAARGGIGPVLKGQAGVRLAVADIEEGGAQVLGQEVTVQTPVGRARLDLATRSASGEFRFVEVNNGPSAALSRNQQRVFSYIRRFGGTPVGTRAAEAGFIPGEPIGPQPVDVLRYGP